MVITELPPEPAKDALEELCSSVVTPLQVSLFPMGVISNTYFLTVDHIMMHFQEVINQGPEVLEKKHARELTVYIDRFAYIFR